MSKRTSGWKTAVTKIKGALSDPAKKPALASLFTKSPLLEYPWLLTTNPSRTPIPSFWDAMKQSQKLAVATKKAKAHLHDPAYAFPGQFLTDASTVIKDAFDTLSHASKASAPLYLKDTMVRGLYTMFIEGKETLASKGQISSFILHSTPKVTLTKIELTYGPYPPPEGYIAQEWFDLMTLIVPGNETNFISHAHQKELLKTASDAGVYMKLTTRVDVDIEFILSDVEKNLVLLRDRRKSLDVVFVSPHFTPWDEMFDLQENGGWVLKWKWRICDMDGLLSRGYTAKRIE